MLDFCKNHKLLTAFIILGVFFLVIVVIILKEYVFINGNDLYGNRLDGIESYPISKTDLNGVCDKVKENENVVSASSELKGKIINFNVKVKAEMNIDDAKGLTNIILENFSDEEKAFYDFQIYLSSEDVGSATFPKIGYKHSSSSEFSWTNN